MKCLSFIIIHIFSAFLQSTCFICKTYVNKLWNNNRTVHVNERNQNKNKTKSSHIQIDHAFNCSILLTNNAIASLKDGFTVWRQSQKEDF